MPKNPFQHDERWEEIYVLDGASLEKSKVRLGGVTWDKVLFGVVG